MFRWYVVKDSERIYGWSTNISEASEMMAGLIGKHDVSLYTYESRKAPQSAYSTGELISRS